MGEPPEWGKSRLRGRVSNRPGKASEGTGRPSAPTRSEVRSHDGALTRGFGSDQPLGRDCPHCCVANSLEGGQGANSETRPLQKPKQETRTPGTRVVAAEM